MAGTAREPSSGNPLVKIAQAVGGSPVLRDRLWADPRAVIEQLSTKSPPDVIFEVHRGDDGREYFQSSIPKIRKGVQAERSSVQCPFARLAGQEVMQDPIGTLEASGIRVPEDVEVSVDDDPEGYVHFRILLESHQEVPPTHAN